MVALQELGKYIQEGPAGISVLCFLGGDADDEVGIRDGVDPWGEGWNSIRCTPPVFVVFVSLHFFPGGGHWWVACRFQQA